MWSIDLSTGSVDVDSVGFEYFGEDRIVVDRIGEASEELRDLVVGAISKRSESLRCARHRRRHQRVLGLRDVQQIARLLHDHQPVARLEGSGEVGRHDGDSIASIDQLLALDELSQRTPSRQTHGWVAYDGWKRTTSTISSTSASCCHGEVTSGQQLAEVEPIVGVVRFHPSYATQP